MCVFSDAFFLLFCSLSLSLSLSSDKDILQRDNTMVCALSIDTQRPLLRQESSKTNTTKEERWKDIIGIKIGFFASFGRRVCLNKKRLRIVADFWSFCARRRMGRRRRRRRRTTEENNNNNNSEKTSFNQSREELREKNGVSVNAQIRLVDRWKKKAAASTNG